MNTTSDLTSGEKSGDGLATSTEDTGLWVNLETTHGVVEDRCHEGNIEDVVHLPFAGLEKLFAEWAFLCLDDIIVIFEGLFELSGGDAYVLGESGAVLISFHETTANVVFAVPLNLLGSFTVENKSDWVLEQSDQLKSRETAEYRTDLALLFPNLSGDVVAVLQLVNESLALTVE